MKQESGEGIHSSTSDPRAYEVKFGAKTEFAILPGESPLAFEILHGGVAAELLPDGPLEEDLVLTIAKCIWRKQRYQRFVASRVTAAKFDPTHEAYDELTALHAFYVLIDGAVEFLDIEENLATLAGWLSVRLNAKCPKSKYATPKAWVKALQNQIEKVLMPAAVRYGRPPDEVLIKQSSAILTDEVFSKELEFEARIDAALQQALDRFQKVKAAKRQRSFRDAQRFGRSHPIRIVGFAK